MFQVVSIAGILAAVLASAAHYAAFARRRVKVRGGAPLRRYSLWERAVSAALAGSFAALAVTAFIPALRGERLSGWLLMAHVTFGGVFAVALAAAVLRWGHDCRYVAADWLWLKGARRRRARPGPPPPAERFDPAQKTFFWAFAALGLTTILTSMFSMVPLFGPEGIDALTEVHRYCALAMVLAAIGHLYRAVLARPGGAGAMLRGEVGSDWARRYHRLWWRRTEGKQQK